jgi:cell division protein FtsA
LTKFKFLRKRGDYYRHFSVLDIGTDLIKVLVVRRDGLDGEVLGVGREPQAPAAMSGGAIADLESVIQSCNRALEAAEDMAKTVPGQVVVGIAGELIKGFSSTIAYPREDSKGRVRSGEVSAMLQMVQRRALREAQHLLELERSYGQLEARLVHSAITNIRVDGYPVTNPVGFTGKNLEIADDPHRRRRLRRAGAGPRAGGRSRAALCARACMRERGNLGRGRHLRRHRRRHH